MGMPEDVRNKKKELRKKILALRNTLPLEERGKKSKSIHSRLFSLPEFVTAKTLAFYVSFKSEVLTGTMIREALSLGKAVVVPITDLANRRLKLSRIVDYTADLAPGTWGILEPKPDRIRLMSLKEVDLIITPGAAFDKKGCRIGYGGGFYDSLLKSVQERRPSVALAFELQMVEEVPVESGHDEPVEIIITEERVIRCKK
jgi:5-formyltetrahydrofolate cyclo-ligase